jgi:hypothetical protein
MRLELLRPMPLMSKPALSAASPEVLSAHDLEATNNCVLVGEPPRIVIAGDLHPPAWEKRAIGELPFVPAKFDNCRSWRGSLNAPTGWGGDSVVVVGCDRS